MAPSRCLWAVLWAALLFAPAEAACFNQPKTLAGKILDSADGVATATSSNTVVSAPRNGIYANSTQIVNRSFFYDAGSLWGTWCVGDPITVSIATSAGQGTYTAATSKSLTTDNPEVFPDATLQAPAPTPTPTPPPTP
ncbi:MAG: hypothetical protein QXQ87_05600, partial [Halobacteria archaeon]